MARASTVGLFAGLLLGLALIIGDFGDMLIVALFGILGYLVARVLEGDLDLDDLLNRSGRSRR